jgi:transposase
VTTEQLEEMPMFDLTEDLEWLQDWQAIHRVPSPHRRYRNYSDDLEPLFQNNLSGRMMTRPNGASWIASHLGIPRSTMQGWHRKHAMDPDWRPWHDPRKGTFAKFSREDCEMLRDALMRDPRMTHKEVNASQILQMLQEIWIRVHPQREFPMMCLDTVRRMLRRWGWSWRRAHKRHRPDVDPQSAIHFVFQIPYLLAAGVDPADIRDADETAFLLYPQGFYTWARRGR